MEQPVCLITGAGKGIGRAAAIEMAGKLHRLVLSSRTASDLKETARLAGGGHVHAADVSDVEQAEGCVRAAVEQFGRIDVVINCAGVAPLVPITETTPRVFRDVIDTNLTATYATCRAAWPHFLEQGGGTIVNVSSMAARDPLAGLSAYGSAKAAINLLGVALDREGRDHGIRVFTVAPGAVETEMLRKIVSPSDLPTDQCLSPEDVGRVICHCISGDLRGSAGQVIWLEK